MLFRKKLFQRISLDVHEKPFEKAQKKQEKLFLRL